MNNPKENLRRKMRLLRGRLSPEDKLPLDEQIAQRLWNWPEFQKAQVIYLYASLKQEVDTWGILEQLWIKKIPVALPRVEGKLLQFFFVDNRGALETGTYGILEPAKTCLPAQIPDAMVIIPGLVFSVSGDRIGYGGGYYDRYLAQYPKHPCVALAYPFQIKNSIATEKTDRRIQWIVTSDRIIECPQGA